MIYEVSFELLKLKFKFPAGTSRGVLHEKDSWFITIYDTEKNINGVGECSILPGLSRDEVEKFPELFSVMKKHIEAGEEIPESITEANPALAFALETAWLDLEYGGRKIFYENDFSQCKKGIPINGLIWMGNEDFMLMQVEEKLAAGYSVIKMKVGALDFETEVSLLKKMRNQYGFNWTLRLDANGAFAADEALKKLEILSGFSIHSIEQPIAAGQHDAMKKLCAESPIPIALDEELISAKSASEKEALSSFIQPQYIILKPSLLGGLRKSEEWIKLAKKNNIGWWVTSALESNVGLNAIAQWASSLKTDLPQGLGTGSLFTENTPSQLSIENGELWYGRVVVP